MLQLAAHPVLGCKIMTVSTISAPFPLEQKQHHHHDYRHRYETTTAIATTVSY